MLAELCREKFEKLFHKMFQKLFVMLFGKLFDLKYLQFWGQLYVVLCRQTLPGRRSPGRPLPGRIVVPAAPDHYM